MSNNNHLATICFAVVAPLVFASADAGADNQPGVRYGQAIGSRLVVQEEMGRWLSDILTRVSDPYPVLVTVELQLHGQLREVTDKQVQPGMDMQLGVNRKVKLPGLPTVDQKLGARGMSVKVPGRESVKVTHELDTIVERMTLRMFVEEDMPEERVESARALAASLAGIDAGRGDAVEVIALSSLGGTYEAAASGTRGGLALWQLAAICGTVLLSFVVLAVALGRRRRSEATRIVGELSGVPAGAGAAELADAGGPATADETTEAGADGSTAQETRVFESFCTATSDEQIDLLSRIDPGAAAVVIDQVDLDPDVTRRLFERIPPERQFEIAVALSEPMVIPATELERLEQIFRERLQETRANITVGGHVPLASVLQEAPETTRDALLAQLIARNAALGEQLRDRMVLLEDIVRFPKETIRQVVTELDPQVTALALRDAPESVRDAVLAAVSRRLRAVLEAEADGLENSNAADGEGARRAFERAMRRSANGAAWA